MKSAFSLGSLGNKGTKAECFFVFHGRWAWFVAFCLFVCGRCLLGLILGWYDSSCCLLMQLTQLKAQSFLTSGRFCSPKLSSGANTAVGHPGVGLGVAGPRAGALKLPISADQRWVSCLLFVGGAFLLISSANSDDITPVGVYVMVNISFVGIPYFRLMMFHNLPRSTSTTECPFWNAQTLFMNRFSLSQWCPTDIGLEIGTIEPTPDSQRSLVCAPTSHECSLFLTSPPVVLPIFMQTKYEAALGHLGVPQSW